MTRLIASTSYRLRPHDQVSGFLYVVDLETRKVLRESSGIETPFREGDANPRGGLRGMRGISVRGGEVALANYAAVFVFDRHWNLMQTLTHPACAMIHEILFDEDGLWVTSTINDQFLKFDRHGELIARHVVTRSGQLTPVSRKHLAEFDYRNYQLGTRAFDTTHLNSIHRCANGDLLVSLGLTRGVGFSALLKIKDFLTAHSLWEGFVTFNRRLRNSLGFQKKTLSEMLVQPASGRSIVARISTRGGWKPLFSVDRATIPSHSVREMSDGSAIYLDSTRGGLIHFDAHTGRLFSFTCLSGKFLRGAVEVSKGNLVIGAGNELLLFDLFNRKLTGSICLSEDELNAVHGLEILPPEFDLPPVSFAVKLGRMAGFDGRKVIWERAA